MKKNILSVVGVLLLTIILFPSSGKSQNVVFEYDKKIYTSPLCENIAKFYNELEGSLTPKLRGQPMRDIELMRSVQSDGKYNFEFKQPTISNVNQDFYIISGNRLLFLMRSTPRLDTFSSAIEFQPDTALPAVANDLTEFYSRTYLVNPHFSGAYLRSNGLPSDIEVITYENSDYILVKVLLGFVGSSLPLSKIVLTKSLQNVSTSPECVLTTNVVNSNIYTK